MRHYIVRILLGATMLFCIGADCSVANEPLQMNPPGDQALPPALAALQPTQEQILSEEQAAQIRGDWMLQLRYPLFATNIEGHGSYRLNLTTLAGGRIAGQPIAVSIRIGR